jgi:signal transduction histidine kinase
MIRDTSSQDAVLAAAPAQCYKRRAIWIGGVVAAVAASALLLSAWRGSEGSVNASRLRIAEVTRGTFIDPAQMEQALLNLLKNAHESGSAPDQVELHIKRVAGMLRIEVMDRGQGMNEAVLTNALVPFYSTKRSGTGLGLALSREIAEAHGGRITLGNRDGGGLTVTLILPERDDTGV